MHPIDLQKLSDFDFENLCKDIFTKLLGVNLELFTPGPDAGVDLRHLGANGEKIIVQCKHWMRSGRTKFVSHMLDVELSKVRKLAPTRYVIATTVGMTPQAKQKLYEAFQPYLRSTEDIVGIDEIASTLRDNPEIIKKHIRLWLNDATVLEASLNRNIIWRSQHLADEVLETLRTYVPSRNLQQAMRIVEENHVCVLAGPPGVGKSTLAQVLCAYYASQSFELIEVSENIEDVFRTWDKSARQVFIYDDFLGQSSLYEKLHKNEDSRLLSAIARIRQDSNKRLICTTRTYILNQARQRYERLDRADLEPITFTVNLEGFTREEKAKILYNHVFWSKWPQRVKGSFAHPESYRPILRHANFNPRAIANVLATDFDPDFGDPAEQVLASLDNPLSLWEHVFDNQLSDAERILLALLFSLDSKALLSRLREAFTKSGAGNGIQFKKSLRILEGSLVRTFSDKGNDWVQFSNPSINDFMLVKLANETDMLLDLLKSPFSFDQVANLWDAHTGPCDAEVPAKIDLQPHTADFELAALATFWRTESTDQDLVRRIGVCLRIAEKLDVPQLEKTAVEALAIPGRVYGATHLDDIAHLLQLASRSRNIRLRARYKELRWEGLTALFNRDRRECGLFRAATYALWLRDLIDEEVRHEICAEADQLADAMLDLYCYGPADPDSETLQYGLTYMAQYKDCLERWPMSAELFNERQYESMDFVDDEEGDEDEVAQIDPELVDGHVYFIMSSLLVDT
ncbi:restriction endonuclease [Streptomyces iakyrus]|uniref:nSTAND3 domain-containing NTPase n=1 Tax=Streptomyces iakyrus TaxID=68219 RepID=UPI0038177C69